MGRDNDRDIDIIERVTTLEVKDVQKEVRIGALEKRNSDFDNVLFKFIMKVFGLVGLGTMLGAVSKPLRDKIIGWLPW